MRRLALHRPYDGTLEVWRAADGWRWRLRNRGNGQVVAGPQEGYTDRDHAWSMGEAITEAMLAQWRESAEADLADERPWQCHPAAILAALDLLAAAPAPTEAGEGR